MYDTPCKRNAVSLSNLNKSEHCCPSQSEAKTRTSHVLAKHDFFMQLATQSQFD